MNQPPKSCPDARPYRLPPFDVAFGERLKVIA
jgi:hypothetical protein